ncbi:MAG: limonene-1,2-epoxide hydrolase family protein [Porticoccaceae bacterium]
MNSLDTVKAFVAAMEANDKDRILAFFDEQSVFNNIPVGSVRGRDEIWNVLGSIHEHALSVEYVLHNIVADEAKGVVLTERTDCYELADRTIRFRAMGVFEIADGRIREWRDYFDLQQCMGQMPAGTEWPA